MVQRCGSAVPSAPRARPRSSTAIPMPSGWVVTSPESMSRARNGSRRGSPLGPVQTTTASTPMSRATPPATTVAWIRSSLAASAETRPRSTTRRPAARRSATTAAIWGAMRCRRTSHRRARWRRNRRRSASGRPRQTATVLAPEPIDDLAPVVGRQRRGPGRSQCGPDAAGLGCACRHERRSGRQRTLGMALGQQPMRRDHPDAAGVTHIAECQHHVHGRETGTHDEHVAQVAMRSTAPGRQGSLTTRGLDGAGHAAGQGRDSVAGGQDHVIGIDASSLVQDEDQAGVRTALGAHARARRCATSTRSRRASSRLVPQVPAVVHPGQEVSLRGLDVVSPEPRQGSAPAPPPRRSCPEHGR